LDLPAGAVWDSPKAGEPEEREEGRAWAWLAFGAALTAAAFNHEMML